MFGDSINSQLLSESHRNTLLMIETPYTPEDDSRLSNGDACVVMAFKTRNLDGVHLSNTQEAYSMCAFIFD